MHSAWDDIMSMFCVSSVIFLLGTRKLNFNLDSLIIVNHAFLVNLTNWLSQHRQSILSVRISNWPATLAYSGLLLILSLIMQWNVEDMVKSCIQSTLSSYKIRIRKPSWQTMEAREVVGGANVSQITTLAPLELYPVAAITDPLEVMYVTSLQR